MSARDRSWTVAPTLLWFAGCLIVALVVYDGDVQAVADRFTRPRPTAAADSAAGGPTFAAAPTTVAEASEDDAATKPVVPVAADRGKILALEDTCLEGAPPSCKKWAMDGFYRAIAQSKQHKLGRAVRVSWYGDSVIATDAIPGRLRTLLQTELGDGGPGFVFAVPPHRFCGHEAIVRSSGGTWQSHAISTMQIADGLYGVGGGTTETEDGRISIKLVAGTASRAELYYLEQPHGGTAAITADGVPVATVDTKGAAKQAGFSTAATIDGGAKSRTQSGESMNSGNSTPTT